MKDYRPDQFTYTALFCEENIWLLAQALAEEGQSVQNMRVLFFSNPWKQLAMSNQKAAPEKEVIIWDYHVVLEVKLDERTWIFDMDSRLPFPSDMEEYFIASFPDQSALPEQYRAWVRSIPADSYLRQFYSDRSHMLDRLPADQFPPYPIIQPENGTERILLSDYWDMEKQLHDGSYTYQLSSSDETNQTD